MDTYLIGEHSPQMRGNAIKWEMQRMLGLAYPRIYVSTYTDDATGLMRVCVTAGIIPPFEHVFPLTTPIEDVVRTLVIVAKFRS